MSDVEPHPKVGCPPNCNSNITFFRRETSLTGETRYGSLPLRPEEYVSDDGSTISTFSLSSDGRRNNIRRVPVAFMVLWPLIVGVVWLSQFNRHPQPDTTKKSVSSFGHEIMMYGKSNHNKHVIDLLDDDDVNSHNSIDMWDAIGSWGINHPRQIRLWAAKNGGNDPVSFPHDITFAQIAALLVPAYFKASLDSCVSTIVPAPTNEDRTVTSTSVLPGEVWVLRKTILKTRDLFDVFSPVYPKHTKNHHISKEDEEGDMKKVSELWRALRTFLANGYRLIGAFQDLDHAQIMYTPEQLLDFQQQVWAWNTGFLTFVEENMEHIFQFLSFPCGKEVNKKTKHGHCRYAHHHVSHLFWGTTPEKDMPFGSVDKAKHVLAKLGNIQLKRAETYLIESLTYEYVLNSTQATVPPYQFSKRRLFDELLEGETIHDENDESETDKSEEDRGVFVNVQEIYHNVRKELRSFLDELAIFGDLLLPDTYVIPEILRDSNSVAKTAAHSYDPVVKIRIDQAVKVLETTRTVLGDLNDEYAAHAYYQEYDMYPDEQLKLQISVEAKWKHFRKWQEDNDLVGKMRFLRDVMMHPDRKWTLSPSASPSPTSNPSESPTTTTSPTSSEPTGSPTTANPSSSEPTLSLTKSPASPSPTSEPTESSTTTASPTSSEPTVSTTTATPSSGEPTLSPTKIPATNKHTSMGPLISPQTNQTSSELITQYSTGEQMTV